jgi:SOS-response transcriptional repressor LexA
MPMENIKPARTPPVSAMVPDASAGSCGGGESFALMVYGESMAPEFLHGEIIIIEPEGLAKDGAYVLALLDDEWTFRQLTRTRTGLGWCLHALNPAFPDLPIPDLSTVKGVIIQKSVPGRRRASRRYV